MLDAHQMRAVRAEEPRILVLAGAGSGKTRVLVARVEALRERGTPLSLLCAITFSKAAADEMGNRLLPETSGFLANSGAPQGMQIGTIHALGFKILRGEIPGRQVADAGHTKRLIRRAIRDTGTQETFADCVRAIDTAKRDMTECPPPFRAVFGRYQDLLIEGHAWDFNDLLSQAVRLLEDPERPHVRAKWQGLYDEILVDEVQDTSRVQWRLIRALCTEETRLFLVGDMGQAIYSWRGADSAVLAEAERELGPFARYELPANYRSRPEVVALANRLLAGHPGAVVLQPTREASEREAVVAQLPVSGSPFEEGRTIAAALKQAKATGLIDDWGDAAVLVRVNAATEPLEAACVEAGVPAIVFGGVGFYARTEVQDVLAYLRLAVGWDTGALGRIFNRPSRYLGAVFLQELDRHGGWAAVRDGGVRFSRRGYQEGVDRLLGDIAAVRRAAEGGPAKAVRAVLNDVGYRKWCLGEQVETDADEALGEVFDSLVAAAERWKTVPDFLALADVCAKRARGAAIGRVMLSTVHKFKGLEAPLVIVAAVNDGLLPHRRATDLKEERRIFYVAVTRARDMLLLSASGRPSVFYQECAEHLGPARALLAQEGVDGAGTAAAGGHAGGGEPGRSGDAGGDHPRGGGEPAGAGARVGGAADGLGEGRGDARRDLSGSDRGMECPGGGGGAPDW